MDGFFQNLASQPRNDLPVLEKNNGVWEETAGHSCTSFTAAQNGAITFASVRGGYWLDSEGRLRRGGFFGRMNLSRLFGTDVIGTSYVSWSGKGDSYSVVRVNNSEQIQVVAPSADDEGYIARIDYRTETSLGTQGRTVGEPSQGLSFPSPEVRHGYVTGDSPQIYRGTYDAARHGSGANAYRHLSHAASLGGSHAGSRCPEGSHPRGEDGAYKIGQGTGRTLSSVNDWTKSQLADIFWCRSDSRYPIRYLPNSITGTTCGTGSGAPECPSGVTIPTDDFTAWGRVNCYYTALSIDSDGNCVYPYPVPLCTDPDNNAQRYFKVAELATYATGSPFHAEDDGSTVCAASPTPVPTPADAPELADFDDDACVTVDLVVAENRVAASNAEPGVEAADRTLTTGTSLPPAWDLDVTSPHHRTASPPKDTGDRSGCADGSESRADHAVAAAGAARSQASAPTYASSSRTDTAPPPNDADGDISYTGAAQSIAHRYASNIAEHTCSAKLAEAEAELALLEEREAAFTKWLSDYNTITTDTNIAAFSGYTKTAAVSGSGLSVLRFNDVETSKQNYANAQTANFRALSAALVSAKTAYDTATDRNTGPDAGRATLKEAASDNGCAAHYDMEISRLKTLFLTAETAALNSIADEELVIDQAIPASVPGVAQNDTDTSTDIPDISANLLRRETICLDTETAGGCWRVPGDGERCSGPFEACPGRTTVRSLYTCPGGSYRISGTVSRTYKGQTRTASYSRTFTALGRGAGTSQSCPGFRLSSTGTHAYYSEADRAVSGSVSVSASRVPTEVGISPAASLAVLAKLSLLGSYYPTHSSRTDLTASDAEDRDAAGITLSVSAGPVPSGSPQEVTDYQTDYKTAYDNAYTQATGHMSGTAWESFDWRYETPTLAWGSYREDPAATGGCDLIAIDSDGAVTVTATRLNFEGSGHGPEYGVGLTLAARGETRRTCKARRARTPELNLEYQPAATTGTDSSKASTFWHVNYQDDPATDERFALYEEAEVFAVRVSLADSPPVLCHSTWLDPITISNKAAAGANAFSKTMTGWASAPASSTSVFRPLGWQGTVTADHCFAAPASGTGWAVFDDTAHSAMAETRTAWLSGVRGVLAASPTLRNSAATAYPGDTAQSSSFYGTVIAPDSTDTTTGWDVPDRDVASASSVYVLEASDKVRPSVVPDGFSHLSRFNIRFVFLDCLPDIRNLAFIHNIAAVPEHPSQTSPTSAIPAVETFGSWDANPNSDDVAGWYYPPASADARARPATVTIPPVNPEGFPHPDVDDPTVGTPEEKYWQIYYHRRIGSLASPQGVAAVRIVPDVTAFDADGRQTPARLAEARRICGTDRATVPSYSSLPGHNMGLLPYYSSATDGGQPLVIWTDHRPDWCGRVDANGAPDCPVWEPCDIASDY